jgi:hypothetical protein
VFDLRADSRKARRALGWDPIVDFGELVRMMVDADLANLPHQLRGGAAALRVAAELNPLRATPGASPIIAAYWFP